MKRQLSFWLDDIWNHKAELLFNFIQIAISFCLLFFIVNEYLDYETSREMIDSLTEQQNIYTLKDMTDDKKSEELINDASRNADFREMADFVDGLDCAKVAVDSSGFAVIGNEEVPVLAVSGQFFSVYDIAVSSPEKVGSAFSGSDPGTSDVLPAVVGNAYRKQYKEGDRIRTDTGETFEIAAFLDKGQGLILPMQGKELLSLDDYIITPIQPDRDDNLSLMMYILSHQFFADDEDVVKAVADKSNSMGLLDLTIKDYTSQMTAVRQDIVDELVLIGSFTCILLFFAFVGIMGTVLHMIEEYQYEYAVNMICGACRGDIYWRIGMHVFFLLISAAVIPVVIGCANRASLLVLAFALIGAALCFAYVVMSIRKLSIIDIVRRYE